MKVPFFKTTIIGDEQKYVTDVLSRSGSFFEKSYIQKCEQWVSYQWGIQHFFLTKSCTQSLELAALILDIKAGDEVIMPSFAFVSCANAFALRGATCVFVDIHPDTMNIDESKIEEAITHRTKAILTLNYGGVSCDYHAIKAIAKKNNLYIVEDNAHGAGAKYGDEFLGSFGHISTFSFDHLKSINCGQGGGIAINDASLLDKFYIHYEFGTNRRSFMMGKNDRYEWHDLGSNYPLSELNAAMLYTQLEHSHLINQSLMRAWNYYYTALSSLAADRKIVIPKVRPENKHCGYNFYITAEDVNQRNSLMKFLSEKQINAQFHYSPIHKTNFVKLHGRFSGSDQNTIRESNRLLRLPLYYAITNEELEYVVEMIKEYYAH